MHCVVCWMLVTLFIYILFSLTDPTDLVFILKHFTLVSTVFVRNEFVFCRSKQENGSREKLRVLSGDRFGKGQK